MTGPLIPWACKLHGWQLDAPASIDGATCRSNCARALSPMGNEAQSQRNLALKRKRKARRRQAIGM